MVSDRATLGHLLLAGVLCACAPVVHADSLVSPSSAFPSLGRPSIRLSLPEGELQGFNRGEFGGGLAYVPHVGAIKELLNDNVLSIVRNTTGIFVFTGLSHMYTSRGAVWKVDQEPTVAIASVATLAGAPDAIEDLGADGVRFRIYVAPTPDDLKSGHYKPGRYECMRLVGASVVRADGCNLPR